MQQPTGRKPDPPADPGPAAEAPPRATVVATLAGALPEGAGERRDALAEVRRHAEVLEVRADAVGDLDPAELRAGFSGRLLYTLRSRAEGGDWDGSDDRRRERLVRAAEAYDFVDLEAERDAVPEVLERVPAERRIVSWHGPTGDLVELEERFARLAAVPARLYKMVVLATRPGEEVGIVDLAGAMRRDDLVAFAAGRAAAWTRFVAPRLGARVVFGSAAAGAEGAAGQLTVEELARDFGLPELPPLERLFGIAGDRVLGVSLSPRLHNGAYRALGIPAAYLPFETDAFGDFWLEVVESGIFDRVGMPLGGLSVTAPHKRAALAVAGAVSPLAECVGAANTLTCTGGVWEAESTDPRGVLGPLEARGIAPAGRRAAVVGCGGAGRAAAFTLDRSGAEVTLVNRGEARGRAAGERLGLPFVPLSDFRPGGHDLVVQATSLGRSDDDPPAFAVDELPAGAVVVDLVYRPAGPTPLVAAARARGLAAVDGREVLLHQAIDQLRAMTGGEMPAELGARLLGLADGEGPAPDGDGREDGAGGR